MGQYSVRFWGVRGSIACSGGQFARVGGNTSCVEVRVDDAIIILDAGTGAFPLGESLGSSVNATFFLSHFHWDHIQGLPFFRPAYRPGNSFTFYGMGQSNAEVAAALAGQMKSPYFPVGIEALAAQLDFRAIRSGDEVRIGPARVRALALNHPQGCLGYRITVGETSLVYATDTERREGGAVDPEVIDFVRGAALLIYDSQYTDEEYHGRIGHSRRGWGHSTVSEACRVARAGNVRQLALFHHDPAHDDRTVEHLVHVARVLFPRVITAREGLTLSLDEWDDQTVPTHGRTGAAAEPAPLLACAPSRERRR